jgi:23S rRNA (cytosine1962-C5)-methyltransferase
MQQTLESRALLASSWKSYQLIDSGDGQKFEQVGPYRLVRPEPQALWKPSSSRRSWEGSADLIYEATSATAGRWRANGRLPEPWLLSYDSENLRIDFECRLSTFKHFGVFPEQASHWEWIYDQCRQRTQPRFLNLFAYTGGASLAAARGGAEVFHVDSIKSILTWANRNRELNQLEGIHWVAEDAFKFVQREARRNHLYDGIVLDPPAYGIGPRGERWKLENLLGSMINSLKGVLKEDGFLLLNTYSLNLSSFTLAGIFQQEGITSDNITIGELLLPGKDCPHLPLGSWLRWSRK